MNNDDYLITVEELKEALAEDQDLQLLDVRTADKHEAFNIGGKLMPYDELVNRLDELDANKLIVTYCTTGGRSMMALKLLLDAGFTFVKSLDGGVTAWRETV